MSDGADLQALRDVWRGLADVDDPALLTDLAPEPDAVGDGPLAGCGFVVKANIDVVGHPTTAGLLEPVRIPDRSATVVERIVAAGATVLGLANLDQLATGLTGTRSPYGTPTNPIAPELAPGGSSSGSAVAVARGLVPFALGTDTAGSGRVPAALTRTVGIKPTIGWLPMTGVVPAIGGLDVVTVHARSVRVAWDVAQLAGGFDPEDPWSRTPPAGAPRSTPIDVVGTPPIYVVAERCDREVVEAHRAALGLLASAGIRVVELDLGLWFEVARELYGGPWVAARDASFGSVLDREPAGLDPNVASIVRGSRRWSAADAFGAISSLAAARRRAAKWWDDVEALVMPTVPFLPTRRAIAADPIGVNERLGAFTNAANLLDTCAVSVPLDRPADGLPHGVMLVGPAWSDERIVALAATLEGLTPDRRLGATAERVADLPAPPARAADQGRAARTSLVVVGAHLRGQPLHQQLVDLGAIFVRETRTAPCYRLYHLLDTSPPKPGLVRVADGGTEILVEEYDLDAEFFGRFVASVPPPLVIGTVELSDGTSSAGFLCEPIALADAREITSFGGWVAYRTGSDSARPPRPSSG